MASVNPVLRSVTLTSANTTYNLKTLLAAVDAAIPTRCCYIQLQFDPAAGGDHLYIGNGSGDISSDNGADLVATQAWVSPVFDSNLGNTGDINLRSNGDSHVVKVTMVTR